MLIIVGLASCTKESLNPSSMDQSNVEKVLATPTIYKFKERCTRKSGPALSITISHAIGYSDLDIEIYEIGGSTPIDTYHVTSNTLDQFSIYTGYYFSGPVTMCTFYEECDDYSFKLKSPGGTVYDTGVFTFACDEGCVCIY